MEISEIIQILEDYVHSQKEESQFNDAVEQAQIQGGKESR